MKKLFIQLKMVVAIIFAIGLTTNLQSQTVDIACVSQSTTDVGNVNQNFISPDNKYKFTVLTAGTKTTAGTVSIEKTTLVATSAYSGALTIPTTVSCKWKENQTDEKTIKYTVTSIAPSAFYQCTGLTSVTIPNTVTSIGNSAFNRCSGLTGTLTIPNSVTSIGNNAFSYCSGLTGTLTLANSLQTISYSAFSQCTGLTSVTIPNSVTSIGPMAFQGCTNLATVTFEDTDQTIPLTIATSISGLAFSGTGLTSVKIPCRATSWRVDNFSKCSNLTVIKLCETDPNYKLDDGIIYNSDYTKVIFCPAGRATDVTIKSTAKEIGDNAFDGCSKIKKITLNNGLETIGSNAFNSCTGLTSITIPNSVTSIKQYGFFKCTGLTSVTIPNSVTSITSMAFAYCNFTSVTIPNSVTLIAVSAFAYCQKLESVTIPNSVTSIEGGAFGNCSKLKTVTFEDTDQNIPLKIGTAFNSTALTSVTIPCRATSWEKDAFYNSSNLTEINTCPTDDNYKKDDGIIYNSDYTKVILCPPGRTADVTLPSTIKEIGKNAFKSCSKISNITLNSGLKTIDTSAFSSCKGLTSITIPNSVTTINNSTFAGCSGLTSVTIPNSVTSIGGSAFSYCSNLTSITIPNTIQTINSYVFAECSQLKSVTIPNTVQTIYQYAFSKCTGLTSITIPNSVTSIGNNAFRNCSSLSTITFEEGSTGVSLGNLVFNNIKSDAVIINNNVVPPTLTASSPFGTMTTSNIKLHVPCVSVEAYKNSDWKNYILLNNMVASSNTTEISTVTGHNVIPIDMATCETKLNDKVTIMPESSITFVGLTNYQPSSEQYQKVQAKFAQAEFTVQKKLNFNSWNLVGMMNGGASTYGDFNYNKGNNSNRYHDVAASPFDYSENTWSASFPYHYDALPTESYTSMFVWPFADSWLKMNEAGDDFSKKPNDANDPSKGVYIETENSTINDDYTVLNIPISKGNANESNDNFDVTQTNSGANLTTSNVTSARWFAMHNPYTGKLKVKTFIEDNKTKIQGNTIYVYNGSTWDYLDASTTEELLPAEGFMVAGTSSAAGGSETMQVNFNVRQMAELSSKKSLTNNAIKFISKANNTEHKMLARMNENANNGFDINDAYVMFSNNIEDLVEPYFIVDNHAIYDNNFKNLPYETPIGFHASKYSRVEFGVENVPEDIEVSLIDKKAANKETIISDGTTYEFNVLEGENTGRFIVKFNKKNIGIDETNTSTNDITINTTNNEIFINGTNLKTLQIINTLGQVIKEQTLNGNAYQTTLDLPQGAYIIKVTTKNNTKTEKIVIK